LNTQQTAHSHDSPERTKILEYTRKKFHSEGFYKTSMDELSRGLGISKKTIYKHFNSKDELVEQICACTSEEISGAIDKIVESDSDVVLKFVKILGLYSSFTMNISSMWLRDLRLHAPGEAAKIDERRRVKIIAILTKLIRQGKREKLIENIPAPVIINTFAATITSIMNPDFLMKNKLSVHQAFKETYDFLLNGMLTNKGKERLRRTKAQYAKKLNSKGA
jgi:AcrR family transcriptional regulator